MSARCDYCGEGWALPGGYGACQDCEEYHADNIAGPTLIIARDGRIVSKHSGEYEFYLAQIADAYAPDNGADVDPRRYAT